MKYAFVAVFIFFVILFRLGEIAIACWSGRRDDA